MSDPRRTFLLVDGENIDATLGTSLFNRRPQPEERPRWERLTSFAEATWGQPAMGLFFLNASNGNMPLPFVQALLAMGYRPVPLAGSSDEKVVDVGIQRTLEALKGHDADVMLCSHDGDFAPQLGALDDGRRLGLLALREFVSGQLTGLDIPLFDLEDDVAAFNAPLPRVRIIPLSDFDPEHFLR
ncbi:NYN domain-containing protein [Nocardioides cynanchi]|uniref:NYN domain-containing protein n=1 Tax=Nocardioides cynanchi TaxID=2558918 RepID=UPI00124897E1|nr:NYN domain-containing protein [Nocardioides cynanchi]